MIADRDQQREHRDPPPADLTVDVIIPTRNRRAMVTEKVSWLLDLPEVRRVIVVADGCDDGTEASLEALGSERVVVHSTPVSRGPQWAKNLGIARATSDWIVIVDDDDIHPPDFIRRLAETAREADADLVGAPWFSVRDGGDVESEATARRARPAAPALDSVSAFPPARWVETPWLPAGILVRRRLVREIGYDGIYGGSHWREETDLFVSAARAGHRVVLTSLTYSARGPRDGGGIDRSRRLRHDLSVVVNNHRFLRKHGDWLESEGLIRSRRRAEAALVLSLSRARTRGLARSAVRRLRAVARRSAR